MLFNEAEEIFLDDIKAKKRETASKIIATKFKRKSNVLFPSDTMNRKEKLKHTKAGKIVTTNLFDTIIPIDEFEALEQHEQRNRLAYWRTKYQNKEIMTALGVSNKRYYDKVAELGLPKAPRTDTGEKKQRKAKASIKFTKAPEKAAIQSNLEIEPIQPAPAPVQEIIIDGLHLVYNGTFNSEQIIKQMLKFGALLEGEENEFYIELKLVEKAPKK